jgi:hypothetical protein
MYRHHAHSNELTGWPVPFSFPLLDKRLLEFCLSAPGEMKIRDGYSRYLVRRSMDGILPRKIQWRTTKCAFAPDYGKRYRAQIGKARDFVMNIRSRDPVRTIVNVERLEYLINNPDSAAGNAAALAVVPMTIYMICFLRQFGEFRV